MKMYNPKYHIDNKEGFCTGYGFVRQIVKWVYEFNWNTKV